MLGQRQQSSVRTVRVSGKKKFHARLIIDAGSHYQLVKSYLQGMKKYHYVDNCKQEDKVCTGFFDGLEARATDHADRPQWDQTSGPLSGVLIVANLQVHRLILQASCSSSPA